MISRIKQVFTDKGISSYKVQNDLDGAVTQVTVRNLLKEKTKNPHQPTIDLLVNYLCNEYKVSREWLIEGKGEMYLKEKSDIYLEKLGVRFSLAELIKHFEENKDAYFEHSEYLRFSVIEHFVKNKDRYFDLSEYLRLFIKNSVEEGLEKRLEKLKELGVIVKASKKDD